MEIPREMWVEDADQPYRSNESFARSDLPGLEYQAQMLGNPGASSGLEALSPVQKQVVYLAAVRYISATMNARSSA